MLDTTVEEHKSKTACPRCHQKKLITNDSEKSDEVVFNHCLSCGFEFSENGQQREYRKDQDTKDRDDSPWNVGVIIAIAMVVTILSINLSRPNTTDEAAPTQVKFELQQ